MATRFIRLTVSGAPGRPDDLMVRPEVITAFGTDPAHRPGSWIMFWGSDLKHKVLESCTEIATILNGGQ